MMAFLVSFCWELQPREYFKLELAQSLQGLILSRWHNVKVTEKTCTDFKEQNNAFHCWEQTYH